MSFLSPNFERTAQVILYHPHRRHIRNNIMDYTLSTKHRMSKRSRPVMRLSIKIQNKEGDNISPCFKPLKVTNEGDNDPFQKTDKFKREYSRNKIRAICRGRPICINFANNIMRLTRSNAFCISNAPAYTGEPLFR